MVTLMLVTGSVQVEMDVELEEEDVLLVHVTAVLTGALPQEARMDTATDKMQVERSFTAPLYLPFRISTALGCTSSLIPIPHNFN